MNHISVPRWARMAAMTAALLGVLLQPASAMHIAEGQLPPTWCILWGLVSVPFVVVGFFSIKKRVELADRMKKGYEEMAEIKAKSVKEAVEMLPKYTTVYLSNSDKVTSLIDWNTDELEDNFTGEIVLKGVFDLPNGYENSNGVQPEIKITVKPDIVMGDVNGDNQINIEDVTILMKYIVRAEGIDINEASADMNNDGIINILDATEIQILLAK